jgi:hypothetical protein
MKIRALQFLLAISLFGLAKSFGASEPATRADANTRPDVSTDKVKLTPHFYQRDPRFNLTVSGLDYCVPVAISDSLFYFSEHGFSKLGSPDISNREFAQMEMVRTLVSGDYMATSENGTTPSHAIYGIRRFISERGYFCQRLEYEGWRTLFGPVRRTKIAEYPKLDWLKTAVAEPNGAAWLLVGFYVHGDEPDQWRKVHGHALAVVGYGTDGVISNPNILLIDNPGVANLSGELKDQTILLTPAEGAKLISDHEDLPDKPAGLLRISGPGLAIAPGKYDAAFLEGAIVLVIGRR